MKSSNVRIVLRWTAVLMVCLLLLPFTAKMTKADEYWNSIRDSQYEWTCEEADGTVLSGHTRQDKASVACANRTLTDGVVRYVRSGVYRIVRLKDPATTPPPTEPPVEPPVEPPTEPPVEPGETPQVTFGPTSTLIQFPSSISALRQDAFRWEITFTLNTVGGWHGLASRDESGTADPGHLSVWVQDGALVARHQGIDVGETITAATPILAGVEYTAVVSVEAGVGFALWLDSNLEGMATQAWGTLGNDLPLVVAGLCTRCEADAVPPVVADRPADGIVRLAIYDLPLDFPQASSVELNWTLPTEDTEGDPLPPGIPDRISVYKQPGQGLVTHLDGESITYEVTGLLPGEHCFTATAWNKTAQSENSNTACKQAQ
jgi:hypothetical protein